MDAVEWIAHRAGNVVGGITDAAGRADLVELDVHWWRGRIEVRHAKRLLFTRRLWERWYLLPRDTSRLTLEDVLDGVHPDVHLFVDLKGVTPRLSRAIREALADRRSYTVATKSWWLLRPFRDVPGVRTLRSAGNRLGLAVLRRVRLPAATDGVAVHERLLTARLVAELAARGEVFTWGVTDRRRAELLASWGVTGLIVDDLDLTGRAPVEQPPQGE
jgi:glycerophosphoryl diester phosphodiesterase